jgi:hypothetical protein
MSWYKFSFTTEDVTNGVAAKAQDEFTTVFMGLGAPKELALFSVDESGEHMLSYCVHVPVAYESALKGYLGKYGADAATKPESTERSAFLVGHDQDRGLIE